MKNCDSRCGVKEIGQFPFAGNYLLYGQQQGQKAAEIDEIAQYRLEQGHYLTVISLITW